ncbi:hypothetical protein [Vibrio sp. 10N.237.312.B06]|uniref:hypothetical protein n=1 Tax=Vibrio sp. 10N.237.312.B06 TaxID=3229974 RepID=UPI00355915C9
MEWSKVIYSPFLKYLNEGASDSVSFDKIMSTLTEDGKSFNYSQTTFVDFEGEDFISAMQEKGLAPENAYLFIQGHSYADKIENLCRSRVEDITKLIISDLIKRHGENAGQFIGEYCNGRSEPRFLVKTQPITCDYCIPKIEKDIQNFVQTYHS